MYKYKMKNKSQKIRPLISLDVEKHENTAHAIVAGEANGCLFKKVLKFIYIIQVNK